MSTIETASTGFTHPPTACQPGCIRLLTELTRLFGSGNDGCLNPNSVLQPSGRPSWHVYGKAIDAKCDWNTASGRAIGDHVWDYVMLIRGALNLQQMIWGNRIWDISYGERVYHHDDHKNHVHIAIGYQASQTWTPTVTPSTGDDDDMTEDEKKLMFAVLNELVDMVGWCLNYMKDGGYANRDDHKLSRIEQMALDIPKIKAKLGA